MDKNTRNILGITLLCAGAIVWYSSSVALSYAISYFDLGVRFPLLHVAQNILPVLLGGLVSYLMYRVQKIRDYILEVISETKKVIWPNRKETWGATVIVIIAVLISGAVLGVFDWLAGLFMNFILR